MSWSLSEKEIESVIGLPGDRRFSYFVKKVADWEEVWSLKNEDGWVLSSTEDNRIAVPVWPHSEYAKGCALDEWGDCEPALIELSVWIERWTPGIENDGRFVAVFPTPSDKGVVIGANELGEAILQECENF